MNERSIYRGAVAIEVDKGYSTAPRVAMRGERYWADKIVKEAKRYNIPIIERPELIQPLLDLEIDQEVPPALFQALAVILAELEFKK